MPNLPLRSIRIPEPLWTAAKNKAQAEGESLSTIIRQLLRVWVEDRGIVMQTYAPTHYDCQCTEPCEHYKEGTDR